MTQMLSGLLELLIAAAGQPDNPSSQRLLKLSG
jgi:hypothetical protein